MAARSERGVPVAESRALVADAEVPAADAERVNRVKVIYEVRQGDTLSSVARLFRTSVAALRTWNQIKSNRLVPGERLTILTAKAAD